MDTEKIRIKDKLETSRIPLFVSLGIAAALIASYFIFPAFKNAVNEAFGVLTSGDGEYIQNWVSEFGLIGPAVLIFFMVV